MSVCLFGLTNGRHASTHLAEPKASGGDTVVKETMADEMMRNINSSLKTLQRDRIIKMQMNISMGINDK